MKAKVVVVRVSRSTVEHICTDDEDVPNGSAETFAARPDHVKGIEGRGGTTSRWPSPSMSYHTSLW